MKNIKYNELVELLASQPEEVGKQLIFRYLSQDENIMPTLLGILEHERIVKRQLVTDMNVELSRTMLTLSEVKGGKEDEIQQRNWIFEQAKAFYLKWEDRVRCCFKFEGLR